MDFDGDTYDPALDRERLGAQARDVWDYMTRTGVDPWHTLAEAARATGWPEASISARLRDFRKPRFGGHFVDRQRRGEGRRGLWEYRLVVRQPPPQQASLFDAT